MKTTGQRILHKFKAFKKEEGTVSCNMPRAAIGQQFRNSVNNRSSGEKDEEMRAWRLEHARIVGKRLKQQQLEEQKKQQKEQRVAKRAKQAEQQFEEQKQTASQPASPSIPAKRSERLANVQTPGVTGNAATPITPKP